MSAALWYNVYMLERHGKLKTLCVAIAAIATLLLSSSEAGDPGLNRNTAVFRQSEAAQMQGTAERESKIGEADSSVTGEKTPVNIIEDLEKWNHPVKGVFEAEGITVSSIELLKDGTYPIFQVVLPFELTCDNESRMMDIIDKIASANSWWDFELIDKAKDANIIVTCDRQFNMVDEVIINGDRNYFIRLSQKKALENYSFIKPLVIKRPGKLLSMVLNGGWKREKLAAGLGNADSSFDGYDIYYDRGVRIKWSGDRINNIVLNNRCRDEVLKGIDFRDGRQDVVKLLGTPQYEDTGEELFGYKTEGFYIFFKGRDSLKEISIYSRNTNYSRDSLKEILEKYTEGSAKVDLNSLLNELKSRWPDYDLYYNERGGLGITYESIGVSVDNIYEDRGGPYITVYSNFEGAVDSTLELPYKTEGLLEYSNENLLLKLDTDSIFAAELNRIERDKYLNKRRQEDGALSPDGSMKVLDNDGGTFEHAGLYVLSTAGNKPDVELHTGQFTGKVIWLDNRYFIYDVSMMGVFMYDAEKKKATVVMQSDLEAGADYGIESYEAGIIIIKNNLNDNTLSRICTFSKDGTVTVK